MRGVFDDESLCARATSAIRLSTVASEMHGDDRFGLA